MFFFILPMAYTCNLRLMSILQCDLLFIIKTFTSIFFLLTTQSTYVIYINLFVKVHLLRRTTLCLPYDKALGTTHPVFISL